MTALTWSPRAHERRVWRVFESRGQPGLGEALSRLDGLPFGLHYRLDSLYAAGGEGVVFLACDERRPDARLVAKLPLVPFQRPMELSSNFLHRRREQLREEARNLEASASRFLPRFHGLHDLDNPLLDRARGGEFDLPEPVLLMEWMPGFDLDVWLARVHRSDVPVHLLRRNLDRVTVVLLQALVDLEEQGFIYADLRPGNLRMMGRPERRIRLLDAGSLVERGDESGRFPHVPAYLPPELFRRKQETGDTICPTPATQAVMAGRTLYEVATGLVPLPGQDVDPARLQDSHVSAPIADVIDGLLTGSFRDVRPALRYLEKRAVKRVPIPVDPHLPVATAPQGGPVSGAVHAIPTLRPMDDAARPAPRSQPVFAPAAPRPAATASRAPAPPQPAVRATVVPPHAVPAATRPIAAGPGTQRADVVLPEPARRSWWKRLLGG